MMRWKPVINAFAIMFGDRWPVAETSNKPPEIPIVLRTLRVNLRRHSVIKGSVTAPPESTV
jgi:hypothetical protein